MTSQKRQRYVQWLRDTGVEHPSDELIHKTRERALLQIAGGKKKGHQYRLKMVVLVLCSLTATVYLWLKF